MKTLSLILTIALTLVSYVAQAAIDREDEGLDYNSILSRYSKPSEVQRYSGDPLNDVRIHLGVGMINSFFSVETAQVPRTYVAERGVQATLGIDLLSKHWLAEGSIASYGDAQFDRAAVGLKEFELRTVYRVFPGSTWGIHLAGGLAARYLRLKPLRAGGTEENYTTPAGSLGCGFDLWLSNRITLGAEAIIRNALVDETPDQTALNLAFRLDGHF